MPLNDFKGVLKLQRTNIKYADIFSYTNWHSPYTIKIYLAYYASFNFTVFRGRFHSTEGEKRKKDRKFSALLMHGFNLNILYRVIYFQLKELIEKQHIFKTHLVFNKKKCYQTS